MKCWDCKYGMSSLFGAAILLLASTAQSNSAPITHIKQIISGTHSSDVARVAVFGKDDRSPVPKRFRNVKNRIGLLYNGRVQTLCTAFCIAPNMIATAAHCLFGSQQGRRPRIADFTFRIDSGKKVSESRIAGFLRKSAEQNIIAGTTGLRTRPPMDAPRDWAIAKLSKSACKYGVLDVDPEPLEKLVKASDKKQIFQIAYHWDYKHWQLAYSGACKIKKFSGKLNWTQVRRLFSRASELLLHTCDTGGASSGSPILMEKDGKPVVVGINVGSYEQSRVFIRNRRIVKRSNPKIIANTGVNAIAFANFAKHLKSAKIIESSDEILSMQTELKKEGLYRGKLDGQYGPNTRKAIKAYQYRNKKAVTGIPTDTLLAELITATSSPLNDETPLPVRKPIKTVLKQPKDSVQESDESKDHEKT